MSYVFESDDKGGKAVKVQVEEAVEEESGAMREVGPSLCTDYGRRKLIGNTDGYHQGMQSLRPSHGGNPLPHYPRILMSFY